ncbi:MAG: hydroxyacylglutathione hydrolase [Zetaproteobacteria bacterium]|nr:hydroxyacylglutathione hydrolase [Pseudobdellovibrionaceae bacterium]
MLDENLEVIQVPAFSDNYIYIIRDLISGQVGTIDPGTAEPVIKILDEKSWKLDFIFNTHHHPDHVGGNLTLKDRYDCKIIGHGADQRRIPGIDLKVSDGESFTFGNREVNVIGTTGHTKGHIVYWFAQNNVLFCGDTLFSMGCGRLFEGTPAQMWESLTKIKQLPDITKVYCAHEYTEANGAFALTVDPQNENLVQYMTEVKRLRSEGLMTIPSNLGLEKKVNPFLRADDLRIRQNLKMIEATDEEVFAEIRRRKDIF